MLLQRSKLAAATVDRPRLAPPWSIALLGILVLTVLVAIFPHKTLVNRVLEAPQNEITETYLVNLIRTDPANPRLRILLARHQLNSGLQENLDATLDKLLKSPDPELRMEASWLRWRADEQQFQRLDPKSPERAVRKLQLRSQLKSTADFDWSEDMLIEIARRAILFGDSALGQRLLERLAERSDGRSAFWYAEAARTALAGGEYRAAGQFFLIAVQRAPTPTDRQRYFIDAMMALQSGDMVRDALVEAEEELARHPELAESPKVLELLVRFARSVRRPDLADKYARKLLRISLQQQWHRSWLASTYGLELRRVNESGTPRLPFDDRIYTLGYDAFLDNRKLEDAWQVASAAVRQAPESMAWRERLARVSEWTGRPSIALAQWLQVARATGNEEAWRAVLRLAPGLFDDDALRLALEHQMRSRPDDPTLAAELIAAYERLGNPKQAMTFLEELQRRTRQPRFTAQMAALAERMGDDERALALWRQYMSTQTPSAAQAVQIATLLLTRGDAASALEVLEGSEDAGPANAAYWRLRGYLAAALGQEGKAAAAYRHTIADDDATIADYDTLARLLADASPAEAARISAEGWRRFRATSLLIQALALNAENRDWTAQRALLGSLRVDEQVTLNERPEFLFHAAQYYLATGQRQRATAAIDAAMLRSGDNAGQQQALLWLLIDSGEGHRLRARLAAREREWQTDPAMHDVLAAAYLSLGLPDVALRRYLTPQFAAHRNDFLWMMSYADALEQNQEADRAWQLRKRLFLDLQQQARQQEVADRLPANMAALRRAAAARLSMARSPGDPAFSTLRELLRQDRRDGATLSPAARDAVFAWLLDAEQFDAARGWLWQQYARNTARPLWGEMRLALETGDRDRMGTLIDEYAPQIPLHDRIEAARQVGDLRLAQTEAFDAQLEQADDAPLHLQLTQSLLSHSHAVRASAWSSSIGKLDERNVALRGHMALASNLSVELESGRISRNNHDKTAIAYTPDETFQIARLIWVHPESRTQATVATRDSFDSYQSVLIEHELKLDTRLSGKFTLGIDQPASESTPLRVAGMKDIATAAATYHLTRADRFTVERREERFHAQTGTSLGSGQVWQTEFAHAFRGESRSLEASVFWSQFHFSRRASAVCDPRLAPLLPSGTDCSASPDFFMPTDFTFRGIRLSTDMNFEEDYTRAWRPYASVARTWHSSEGRGYDLAAGFAGSVAGADHLAIGWRLSRGGTQTDGLVREFGLSYRLHF